MAARFKVEVAMPTFTETALDQPIFQVVSPIIATRDSGEEHCPGSAFLIGPGWAVTANHVLAECLRRYDNALGREGMIDVSFEVLAFLSLDGGRRHMPLRVIRAWNATPLDIAILALALPEDWPADHRWKVPAIDLLPPKVGARIAAVGFPNSSFGEPALGGERSLVLTPMTAAGEVIEIHHEFRDQARLPFPCFRANARFDGGMSGGPVVNLETGRVCGMICSSLPGEGPDDEHTSYVSTLWPMIATPIDIGPTGLPGAPMYPLVKFYESGFLKADHLANVRFQVDPEGHYQARATYDKQEWDNRPQR